LRGRKIFRPYIRRFFPRPWKKNVINWIKIALADGVTAGVSDTHQVAQTVARVGVELGPCGRRKAKHSHAAKYKQVLERSKGGTHGDVASCGRRGSGGFIKLLLYRN
jgi:hypothetical protein